VTNEELKALEAQLRADPEAAFEIVRRLDRIAGPWRQRGEHGWERGSVSGGTCASSYGVSSAWALAFHDEGLRAEGYLLVGGMPDGLPPKCCNVRTMRQGRPRLDRPGDPRVALECWMHRGHSGRCRALAPMLYVKGDRDHVDGRLCWWSEVES